MTLTNDDLTKLRCPFPVAEHDWQNKRVYIKEEAVTNRIEQVDPSWQFELLAVSQREKQVIVTARMTILGIARDGVGMANIEVRTNSDDPANEPEKSAATDALKRCARLFGIGRYLTEVPKNITEATFPKWLANLNPNGKAPQPPVQSTPEHVPQPTNGNGNGHDPEQRWVENEFRVNSFFTWAGKPPFHMDKGAAFHALQKSVPDTFVQTIADYPGTNEAAMAAIIAYKCDYDEAVIDGFMSEKLNSMSLDRRSVLKELAHSILPPRKEEPDPEDVVEPIPPADAVEPVPPADISDVPTEEPRRVPSKGKSGARKSVDLERAPVDVARDDGDMEEAPATSDPLVS